MAYFISVKVKDDQYKSIKVPKEIYIYVRQLEFCIRHPDRSKLLRYYPGRFIHLNEPFEDVTESDSRPSTQEE